MKITKEKRPLIWSRTKKVIRFIFASTIMCIIIVTFFRLNNFIFVSRVKAFQHTLEVQRETVNPVEQTAMTDRIVSMNEKIAVHKVLAHMPIIKYLYIDEFREMDLIK